MSQVPECYPAPALFPDSTVQVNTSNGRLADDEFRWEDHSPGTSVLLIEKPKEGPGRHLSLGADVLANGREGWIQVGRELDIVEPGYGDVIGDSKAVFPDLLIGPGRHRIGTRKDGVDSHSQELLRPFVTRFDGVIAIGHEALLDSGPIKSPVVAKKTVLS